MNGVNDAIISTLGTALYGPIIMDKSPWGTCVMERIIYSLQLVFEKALLSALMFPLPTRYTLPHMWGGEGVSQVRLYSLLVCAQKRQQCKYVPRLLSMIVAWFYSHYL